MSVFLFNYLGTSCHKMVVVFFQDFHLEDLISKILSFEGIPLLTKSPVVDELTPLPRPSRKVSTESE